VALKGYGRACRDDGPVSVAVWLASALGCAEAFKNIGQLKEGRGRAIEALVTDDLVVTDAPSPVEPGLGPGASPRHRGTLRCQ
jgi:hypothetical protein